MFRQITLLVAGGLVGPLIATWRRGLMPVVIGELAAGALIGDTGLRLLDPKASVFPVFYSLGFAMLMLTAGTHVDPRSRAIRAGAARGALALLVVLVAAVPLGLLIGAGLSVGHQLLLIVLLAGSSAAVAFPIMEERGLTGSAVAYLTAWIALADSVTVVLMPLSLTGAGKLIPALAGDAAVIIAGLLITLIALRVGSQTLVKESVEQSRRKGWALQLRLSVLLLLVLGSVAEVTGASTLVAGFVAGMVLIRLGPPDRLNLQISGLANGFFVPIFFVLLGAELDLRSLVSDPRAIAFALAMALAAVIVHEVAALATGASQRVASGLAASAQLGLPAAAAGLAIANHLLSPAIAAALVAAGCLTLAPATIGAARLKSES
jgi:Kef-type K+ transport system membrane component KefB